MDKIELKRKFKVVKGNTTVELPDPDPAMSAQEVQKFYSRTYPELMNASVTGPEYEEDAMVFSFKAVVGTKG